MVVSMGIPRPVDLKRASGLTPIRIAQVHKYAAVLVLELFDWIERAGDQTVHPRIQCAAGDEQERKARTGLRIADSRGAFFVKAHGGASWPGLLSERIRCCGHHGRGGAGSKCVRVIESIIGASLCSAFFDIRRSVRASPGGI